MPYELMSAAKLVNDTQHLSDCDSRRLLSATRFDLSQIRLVYHSDPLNVIENSNDVYCKKKLQQVCLTLLLLCQKRSKLMEKYLWHRTTTTTTTTTETWQPSNQHGSKFIRNPNPHPPLRADLHGREFTEQDYSSGWQAEAPK